jgi:hypothetical protein
MEEVADGAAVLVDPTIPRSSPPGIERATAERDALVARGLERARAFRWDAVADATVGVYREASRDPRRRRRARPPATGDETYVGAARALPEVAGDLALAAIAA